ncbi:MAG: aminofutalosine synthase MqnE [Oligoflexales bacterium]
MTFDNIQRKVLSGERLCVEEALFLYDDFDFNRISALADEVNRRKNKDVVFYNINRHINPTNICALTCRFCAYSRRPGEEGGYEYSVEEIVDRAKAALKQGATEVHMVGGLHPRWKLERYVEFLRAVKSECPTLHIKAFTAVELDWLSKRSRKPLPELLEILREAGLDSLPGGGAEIFHPDVREEICAKLTAEQWLDIHRHAHQSGLHSNCTMLYGHVESRFHRVDHMKRLRDLQDETHGFNAFIPLSFQPHNNEMGIQRYTPGLEDLKTIAIARLFLDNFQHIKAYWIMLGPEIAQLALGFGANDLDGTVTEEKISRMAGGRGGMEMTRLDLEEEVLVTGRHPVERDTLYHPLTDVKTTDKSSAVSWLSSENSKVLTYVRTFVSKGSRKKPEHEEYDVVYIDNPPVFDAEYWRSFSQEKEFVLRTQCAEDISKFSEIGLTTVVTALEKNNSCADIAVYHDVPVVFVVTVDSLGCVDALVHQLIETQIPFIGIELIAGDKISPWAYMEALSKIAAQVSVPVTVNKKAMPVSRSLADKILPVAMFAGADDFGWVDVDENYTDVFHDLEKEGRVLQRRTARYSEIEE